MRGKHKDAYQIFAMDRLKGTMDKDVMPTSDAYPVMRRRKVFLCPHCGERCSLPVAIQVLEPEKYVEEGHGPADPLIGLTEDQRAVVDLATKSGMLEAFRVAVVRRSGGDAMFPANMSRFLISFLKKAAQKTVPRFVLDHYRENFHGLVEFVGADGVLAVIADGKIVAFLPLCLARGVPIRSVTHQGINGRLVASEEEFLEWVKARNGYVPSKCALFLRELNKRSIGAFADVRL